METPAPKPPAARPEAPIPLRPGRLARLRRELWRHRIGYGVLAAFVLMGPLLVYLIFPDASPLLGLLGGLAFGIYAAVSAVPDRFYE